MTASWQVGRGEPYLQPVHLGDCGMDEVVRVGWATAEVDTQVSMQLGAGAGGLHPKEWRHRHAVHLQSQDQYSVRQFGCNHTLSATAQLQQFDVQVGLSGAATLLTLGCMRPIAQPIHLGCRTGLADIVPCTTVQEHDMANTLMVFGARTLLCSKRMSLVRHISSSWQTYCSQCGSSS